MVIFISLLDYDQFRQVASFYHAGSPVYLLIYMTKNPTPAKCVQMYI